MLRFLNVPTGHVCKACSPVRGAIGGGQNLYKVEPCERKLGH
jgi:hypothetical protein